MVSLNLQNGKLTEPVRPSQKRLLLLDNIGFYWSNEGRRAYASEALQKRLEADRLARTSGLLTLIGPFLLISIAAVLWLWVGQR